MPPTVSFKFLDRSDIYNGLLYNSLLGFPVSEGNKEIPGLWIICDTSESLFVMPCLLQALVKSLIVDYWDSDL